jgi:O-antigen/teichoic acid export membrane protein
MIVRLNSVMPKGSFLRNVTMLSSSTLFAQGLSMLALPLLTRLYGPEGFDLLAVYVAAIGILGVVAALRYNLAIPIAERDDDAMALLAVALTSITVVSLLLCIPVIFWPEASVLLLGQTDLLPYLWMIPAGVFAAGSYDALQYWTTRRRDFGLITRTRVTRAVGGVATQAGIGAISSSPFGLLFGHMIYGGLGAAALVERMFRRDSDILGKVTTLRMREQMRAFSSYPKYSVPEALFNVAGIQVPLLLIAANSAGSEAGFLFLAMTVMGAPMALVGSSVAQVYVAEAPDRLREGTLVPFTLKTMWALTKVAGPLLLLTGIVSPFVFPIIFGADWSHAGILMSWMVPWFILQLASSPMSVVLYIVGKFRLAMVLQFAGFAIRVGSVLIAISIAPAQISEIYAVSGALFYALYVGAILVVLKARR